MSEAIHVLSRAIIIDQKHILLCKTTQCEPNFYFLPGGHVEYKETVEQALLRELAEEIGGEFKIIKFLDWLENIFEPLPTVKYCHNHEYNFVFLASSKECNYSKEIKKFKDKGALELEWIKLEDLSEINLKPEELKKLIPEWLKIKKV